MVVRHASLSEAYAVLGLQQGASLEAVKTSYKQLALRTHPDKNQNNPAATQQFQQISSAYNVLLKHLDTSTPPLTPHGFPPFHTYHPHTHSHSHSHSHSSSYEYDDDEYDSEDYYDSEDDCYYEQEEENLDFFMFLFEEMLNGRANRFAGARFQSRPRERDVETEEQYQARIRRQREEQTAAAQRRAAQEEAWKIRRQTERENARAGEERRKQKAETKKAEADALRRSAAQKVRTQQQKSQTLRSAVFAAARRGDAATVRKAVWEDGVDAAGGEVKPGLEQFVQVKPKDPKETLLHLAVVCGDVGLVEWLDRHNAEADERNSRRHTPFHTALQYGHAPIIRYFFNTYPPKESDSEQVLQVSDNDTTPLLRLALHSGEPEVVWLVLDSGLADSKAIRDTWTWICSHEDQAKEEFGCVGKLAKPLNKEKFEETKDLLLSWGGFTPPPTPRGPTAEATSTSRPADTSSHRKGKKGKKIAQQNQTPTPPESPPTTQSMPDPLASHNSSSRPQASRRDSRSSTERGRGGRGRGRGRGRGGAAVHTHA